MTEPAANGSHATKAEHASLRERVEALHDKVDHMTDILKKNGQALDILLAERGLERPAEPDDG